MVSNFNCYRDTEAIINSIKFFLTSESPDSPHSHGDYVRRRYNPLFLALFCPRRLRQTNVWKTKGISRPINGRRHAWILAGRRSSWLRTRAWRAAERCPRHAGDNSPRSFLHGQSRIKHLLAGRIARVPRRGQPSVLRASHRSLFATGNRNSFSADRTSARGYLAPRRLTDTPCQDSAMRNSSPSPRLLSLEVPPFPGGTLNPVYG